MIHRLPINALNQWSFHAIVLLQITESVKKCQTIPLAQQKVQFTFSQLQDRRIPPNILSLSLLSQMTKCCNYPFLLVTEREWWQQRWANQTTTGSNTSNNGTNPETIPIR